MSLSLSLSLPLHIPATSREEELEEQQIGEEGGAPKAVEELPSNEGRKGGGCEVEARRVSYTIRIPEKTRPSRILSRDDGGAAGEGKGEEEEKDRESPPLQSPEKEGEGERKHPACSEGGELHGKAVGDPRHCRPQWRRQVDPPGDPRREADSGEPLRLPQRVAGSLRPVAEDFRLCHAEGYPLPLLTVKETLLFSAKLRLQLPAGAVAAKVESLMRELGLEQVRGISGGEKRRVSIGVDVVHDPRVLILDEPTSGLDSMGAHQIVVMLKAMAEARGRTIILSIHQPGFRIVKLFNSVLLLAAGEALHHGTVDQLQAQLDSLGLQVPLHVNVLEFAIDAIETLQQHRPRHLQRGPPELPASNKKDRCTLQHLFQISRVADEDVLAGGLDASFSSDYVNSRLRETSILTHRYLKNVFRTKELFACRTIQMLVSGLVLGSIFYQLDSGGGAQERRWGSSLSSSLPAGLHDGGAAHLPQEREILMKETSCGSYRVSSYALAMGSSSCRSSSSWRCSSRRRSIGWRGSTEASRLSSTLGDSRLLGVHALRLPIQVSLEGLLVNEFSDPGKCLEYSGGVCLIQVGGNVAIMVCFILLYRFLSYIVLRCRCRCAHRGGLRRALT
ncbi:unnamed protein product [Spirodela intermedia]|uniref:ABC transporter domain-containing protein n=1 Tax=Spirodela intermedia TaxID=51605 RepID=A0A7I8JC41_SPIIN|nr:unnamed protein product [Spirodela intermedia]CAA6667716.1 unnamed protein product [Spirodela intermedia]